jgi:ferrous iron transport protein B
LEQVRSATRLDGTPLFTVPTAWSLLVFYVLAMQCLPTLALVRRETGSWRWPIAQFAWMTAVAYIGALIAYRIAGGGA